MKGVLNKMELDLKKLEEFKEWRKNLTVKQLIEILQTYNPKAHIMIDNYLTNTGQYLQYPMIKNYDNLIFIKVSV